MPVTLERVTVRAATEDGKRTILDDVSCRFDDGAVTLLIGRTGAGKSSLLHALAGLLPPDEGVVRYDASPASGASKPRGRGAAESVGIVFQYPEQQLFCGTVQGEFDYSLRPLGLTRHAAVERVRQALADVGLPEAILERSPFSLSGGEKRRVALATTLATEPDWLLLDEPTAALDGESVRWLTEYIRSRKGRARGGVIVATHDLDVFLPVADRAVVLRAGRVEACLAPVELCARPHILRQAQAGLPGCVRLAEALAARGVPVGAAPLAPTEMAAAIDARLRALRSARPGAAAPALAAAGHALPAPAAAPAGRAHEAPPTRPRPAPEAAASADAAPRAEPASEQAAETPAAPQPANIVRRLDPRAKWLVYVMLSAGFLLQRHGAGIAVSAVVTAAAVLLSGVAPGKLLRMTKPFVWFTLISVLVSGLRLSWTAEPWYDSIGFAAGPAADTLAQLVKIWMVMVLGLLLTLTTTQMAMKRALEQSLSFLSRFGLPVAAFALGASLMLRFIPIVTREVDRLSLVVRARSRSASRRRSIRARDVPALAIPLLMSVLQSAEDLSLAMEVRGYRRAGMPRSSGAKLRMSRPDAAAIAAGAAALCLLLAVR